MIQDDDDAPVPRPRPAPHPVPRPRPEPTPQSLNTDCGSSQQVPYVPYDYSSNLVSATRGHYSDLDADLACGSDFPGLFYYARVPSDDWFHVLVCPTVASDLQDYKFVAVSGGCPGVCVRPDGTIGSSRHPNCGDAFFLMDSFNNSGDVWMIIKVGGPSEADFELHFYSSIGLGSGGGGTNSKYCRDDTCDDCTGLCRLNDCCDD